MGVKEEGKSDDVVDNMTTDYYALGRDDSFKMEYPHLMNTDEYIENHTDYSMDADQKKQYLFGIADSVIDDGLLEVAFPLYSKIGALANPEIVQKLVEATKKESGETDSSLEYLLNYAIFKEYNTEMILTAPDEFKGIYISKTEEKTERMCQYVNERIAKGPEYFYDVDSIIRKFESMRWSRKNIDTRYCMIKKTVAIADAYADIGKKDEADKLYDLIGSRYKDMSFSDLLGRYNKPRQLKN